MELTTTHLKIFYLKQPPLVGSLKNIIDYILTNESDIGNVSDIGSLYSGADYFFAKNIKDVYVNGLELELNTKFIISENKT